MLGNCGWEKYPALHCKHSFPEVPVQSVQAGSHWIHLPLTAIKFELQVWQLWSFKHALQLIGQPRSYEYKMVRFGDGFIDIACYRDSEE